LQETQSTPGITHATTCHEKNDVAFRIKLFLVIMFQKKSDTKDAGLVWPG